MSTESATAPVFSDKEAAEIVDAPPSVDTVGGAIAPPDLSVAESLPVGGGSPDEKRKSTFALLTVKGASLPSASSKFVGTTPKAAVMKAARRIHKRSGSTNFTVLMRRVAAHKVDKKLYKYEVEMKKRSRPTGFVTLVDSRFVVEKAVQKKGVTVKKAGDVEINVSKKVPIVSESAFPVYGHVATDGALVKGPGGEKTYPVVRPPGTNTLYLLVEGDIPEDVNGVPVVKTDWDVHGLVDVEITEAEREEHDIAGRARMAVDELAKKKAEASRAAVDKKKARAREDKAKAKDAAKAKREKDRLKKEASKKAGKKTVKKSPGSEEK